MQRVNGTSTSTSTGGAAAKAKPSPAARPPVVAVPAAAPKNPRKTLPDPGLISPGDELYFAYGSNMSPTVLSGRRQVHPKASQPGIISGYTLSFRLKGLPYIEPGFGTIERSGPGDRDNVHGVVHLITQEEWAAIKRAEGVEGDTTRGYQVVQLPCQLYDDGRTVTVVTLQAAKASLIDRRAALGGDLGVSGAVKPSQRYLQIIQEGALFHGLSREYMDWLQRIQAFDSANVASRLGQMAIMSTLGLGLGIAALGVVTDRAFGSSSQGTVPAGPSPAVPGVGGSSTAGSDASSSPRSLRKDFVGNMVRVAFPLVWFAHDRVLAPFLGKGM